MKLTEEIEEFINLTITEHMGKEYAETVFVKNPKKMLDGRR